jgi:hypothetical protein
MKKTQIEKTLNDLEEAKSNHEYRQLIEMLLPMLFQVSDCRLEISIGKKISDSKFVSYLDSITKKFIIKAGSLGKEMQLFIEDYDYKRTIAVFNLLYIKEISIRKAYIDVSKVLYNITFGYNGLDYEIKLYR